MITIDLFNTGEGITWHNAVGPQGSYILGKHSFNPTSDITDGYQSWDWFADSSPAGVTNVTNYNQANAFSLTGYQYGNEVVMVVIRFSGDAADNGTVTLKFKDPDGNYILITDALAWSHLGAGYFSYTWAGIGIKASGAEIHKNGTYVAEYIVTYNGGADQLSGSVNFDITNYPTATAGTAGYIWVEGDNLCFTCQQGYKIVCKHDGSSSAVGAGNAGHIWLETNGKIAYVDSSGNKRMTKLGDRYGYGGWASEIPGSPGAGNAGYIWVCNDSNDTYLMIVSNNGVKYRIGVGFVDAGDYQ